MSDRPWCVDCGDVVDSPCQRRQGSGIVLLFMLVTRSILAIRDGADCQSAAGEVLLEECCTKMQVSESAK